MLTKQEVTAIQSALREAGFLYKEPDGVWDLHTMQGYRNYLAVKLCTPNSQYISQPTSMDLVPDVLKGGVVEGNGNSQEHNGVGSEPNEPNEPPAPETVEQPQAEQPTDESEKPDVEQPTENGEPTTPEQPEVEQPTESEESEEPAGKPNKGKRSKTQNS